MVGHLGLLQSTALVLVAVTGGGSAPSPDVLEQSTEPDGSGKLRTMAITRRDGGCQFWFSLLTDTGAATSSPPSSVGSSTSIRSVAATFQCCIQRRNPQEDSSGAERAEVQTLGKAEPRGSGNCAPGDEINATGTMSTMCPEILGGQGKPSVHDAPRSVCIDSNMDGAGGKTVAKPPGRYC